MKRILLFLTMALLLSITGQPTRASHQSGATSLAKAVGGGSWTGYWTWNPSTRSWVWTWVWSPTTYKVPTA